MAAIGEMLAGISSREASASLMLTWDEVLTALSGPSGFWGGVMKTAAVMGLFGGECLDSMLDTSSKAQDRRLLTSAVMLHSDFGGDLCGAGYQDGWNLTKGWYLLACFFHRGWKDINPRVWLFTCDKAYTTIQQL